MRHQRHRARRGATLIELLVALLLLDLALLSLASISALAARRIGEARRMRRSVTAAANRLESLASGPCARMSGGSALLERGMTETWTVRAIPGAAEAADSIEIHSLPGANVVLRVRLPC
jgi:Tfp pilus assembly protein PilV